MNSKKIKTILTSIVCDILIAALIVAGTWYIKCKIPRNGVAVDYSEETQNSEDINVNTNINDIENKFADKFSDEIVVTDTSYTSPNISINICYNVYDSGKNSSSKGNSKTSDVAYYLADIYIKDISCIKTGFGQDTYGSGYAEDLDSIANRLNALLAVNGDSYGDDKNELSGTVIRNGVLYRFNQSESDTLVLYKDGSMEIIGPGELDEEELIAKEAYQTWTFGPSLLDEEGNSMTSFNTYSYLTKSHPRTAIGYFEPGHYCLLVVDGRSSESRGMYLDEMSDLFASLGCKIAYNLDGGYSSSMYFNGEIINSSNKLREVTDAIVIVE